MEFTSEINVELFQSTGSDAMIASAARVSTGLEMGDFNGKQDAGLIRYLMQNRHGSPFEHGSMTFKVDAPIFVFREWMRHRIGWSYNEVSGRYKELEPKFYIYPDDRPLVQQGSGAHPALGEAGGTLQNVVNGSIRSAARSGYRQYQAMLEMGAANEVARAVLPVGLYSSMYATANPRSIMAFLSLRVDHENNTFSTKPQWEIQNAAEQVEALFKNQFPATWEAFNNSGRVAP